MRMIGPMKQWIQEPEEISDDSMISADAISDLSTDENCISTWCVGEKSEDEIKKGVLALVSDFRSLEDIKIVFLNEDKLVYAGLTINKTPGKTQIQEYADLHRDIAFLNAGKLQKLAKLILESVWREDIQFIYKETLIQWLLDALNEKKLDFNSLNKNFKGNFAAAVNKMVNKNKIKKDDINDFVWEKIANQINDNKKKTNCKFEIECERYKKVS